MLDSKLSHVVIVTKIGLLIRFTLQQNTASINKGLDLDRKVAAVVQVWQSLKKINGFNTVMIFSRGLGRKISRGKMEKPRPRNCTNKLPSTIRVTD